MPRLCCGIRYLPKYSSFRHLREAQEGVQMPEGAVDDGEDADGQRREESVVERRCVAIHQRLRCVNTHASRQRMIRQRSCRMPSSSAFATAAPKYPQDRPSPLSRVNR